MTVHARLLPLLLVAPLAWVACGGEPTDEPSPTQPQATATQAAEETATEPPATNPPADTPTASMEPGTPEPTAIPTAPPAAGFDAGYRTNTWIMSGDEGVDLNGDSVVDNKFTDVYELSIAVIGEAVYGGAYQYLLDNEVNAEDAQSIASSARDAFLGFMTVENFNALLASAIDSKKLNFAEAVYGDRANLSLSWYSAASVPNGSFALKSEIGVQSGANPGSGSNFKVGPGDLTYDFSSIYDGPVASQVLMLSGDAILVVSDSYSTFTYSEAELTAGDIGGLVSQTAMLNFMRGLVPAGFCNPQTEECQAFDIVNSTLDDLETVYKDAANASLWTFSVDGQPATAVGFGWTATQATLIDQVGQGGIGGDE